MELKGSLMCSQERSTRPYPEPFGLSPRLHSISLRSTLKLFSSLRVFSRVFFFYFGFSNEAFVWIISPMRVTSPIISSSTAGVFCINMALCSLFCLYAAAISGHATHCTVTITNEGFSQRRSFDAYISYFTLSLCPPAPFVNIRLCVLRGAS
jgi:hypothetical protein